MVLRYIGRTFREMLAEMRKINEAYAQEYRRCFEGTPEEVERKLHNWDWMLRTTRSYSPRSSYGV